MPDRPVITNTSPYFISIKSIASICFKTSTAQLRFLPLFNGNWVQEKPRDFVSWMVITSAKAQFLPNITDLGDGEAEVIALGLENPGSLLILDDALGRRIARLYRLTYTGTLGVLVRAKQLGYLDRVEPVMQALQNHGLWISATVMENILQLAGETS